jgi:aminopeptidase N
MHGALLTAIDYYSTPDAAPAARVAAARTALDELRAAKPGSDNQLAWVHNYAKLASTSEDLAVLGDMLDGAVTIEGLEIDQELRWFLLGALASHGKVDGERIDAELANDNTASGHRHAAYCHAGQPTAEAKAWAWQQATTAGELANDMLEAVISGFTLPAHQRLTAPYADRYFDMVSEAWNSRTIETARRIATMLYPSYLVDPRVLDRTDAWLAADDIPPSLRRLVLEGRDDLRRAIRAREVDAAADGRADGR